MYPSSFFLPSSTPKVISYSGTKDKRGVTCQRIAAYKVPIERIASINGWLRGITVGNATYGKRPFKLGDLSGNRFTIVLRDVDADSEALGKAVAAWSEAGYVKDSFYIF